MNENSARELELLEEIAKLKLRIKELEKLVEELLSRLNKNSGNSSKPPSSDGLNKKVNSRVKSDKNRGGQRGHKGSTLLLPENFEELRKTGEIVVKVNDYTNGAEDYISRYTLDVTIQTVYTEHRFPRGTAIPEELSNYVTYGSGIKALTTLLSVEGMLSMNRIASFYAEATNGIVTPSESTINAILHEAADNVNIEELVEDVLCSPVINVDETPMRAAERPKEDKNGRLMTDEAYKTVMETAENKSFQVYIRTHSNETTTVLTASGRKNNAGIVRDDILPRYNGIVVQDYEAKFLKYGTKTGLCGQHLERELKGLYGCAEIRPWAESAFGLMQGMCHYKNDDIRNNVTSCSEEQLNCFRAEYRKIIIEGEELISTIESDGLHFKKARALINRMGKCESEYMLFMENYSVPYTNNLAERDLRPCKTKQKVSGCFRSFSGIQVFCKLKSVISTAKKRGGNLLETIKSQLFPNPLGSDS